MLSNLFTLWHLYKLNKIKEAFEHALIPFPVSREGTPLIYSWSKVNDGSVYFSIRFPHLLDPMFEIRLMQDTANVRFILDALFIDVSQPVRDDLVIELHKRLEAVLDNCFLKTNRLQEGNLAGYYNTSIPLAQLNVRSIKRIIEAAQVGICSYAATQVFEQYHHECMMLLEAAEDTDTDSED